MGITSSSCERCSHLEDELQVLKVQYGKLQDDYAKLQDDFAQLREEFEAYKRYVKLLHVRRATLLHSIRRFNNLEGYR